MSLLPNQTFQNRNTTLYSPLGSGGGSISSIISPNLNTSTIINQFAITTGSLTANQVGAVDNQQVINWKVGGDFYSIGATLDNRSTLQPSVVKNTNSNMATLQSAGIWASANGGGGNMAVFSHDTGAPYIYTQTNGSNVDLLKTDPASFNVALTQISSINSVPIISIINPAVSNTLTVSTLNVGTAGNFVSSFTSQMTVSSINGLVYPPPGSGSIQTASNNPSALSGFSLPVGSFVSLLSTPTNFNFLSGKTYDINLPVGINVSTSPSDAPANIYLGAKVQSDATFTTGAVIHTNPGETQTIDLLPIRWIRTASTTESVPLVYGAYIQNATSNATISANIGSSATNLQFVGQLN